MKTMKTLKLAACLLFLSVSMYSQQVAKVISSSNAPNGIIGFLEFKPSDYGTQKHPLIIFMHGVGEVGNGTTEINRVAVNGLARLCAAGASMRFTVAGQTSSFVVLSPQLYSGLGTWPSYYVKEMIQYAKTNLQIDTNRIYITGLSLGGGGTWRTITEITGGDNSFDGTIAAAAPVCGSQDETDANMCSTIAANHLPVWAFHSMDDGTVGVGATQHAEILLSWCSGITPAPKFTYYQSGGHGGAWDNAYDTGHITRNVSINGAISSFTANPNLYEWFLSNTRATGNTAPLASAGTTQSITLPLSTVTLTGTGTGTNGATISSYSWAKTSGPAAGTITSSSSASTTVTGLTAGTYVFTLTVKDNHGLSTSSAVTMTVIAAPVVADAGPSQTISSTSTVLSASASYSPNGSITSYEWQQVSGPAAATIVNANSATPVVSNMALGSSYSFELTVTDIAGASASAVTGVTVMSSTLPVEFSYFNGQKSSTGNILQWATATEQNNDYFSIERSEDGNGFTSVGRVAGAGTSNSTKEYSFTDTKLSAATYYYRLKQVDKDGKYIYSKVILLRDNNTTAGTQLYPNPVLSTLSIAINNDAKGNGKITVYDLTGRNIREETVVKNDKVLNAVVNMNNLSAGLYLVEIKIGDTFKLTKNVLKK